MKRGVLFIAFVWLSLLLKAQNNVLWVGSADNDYFTSSNWDPVTDPSALDQTEIMMITKGSPNACMLNGGNVRLNYRPAQVNVLSGATFTVNGKLYPWGSDSLNGIINIGSGGDFNIRGTTYVGRNGSSIININGGSLTSNNILYVATGNEGSDATINMNGGALYANSTLNIAIGTDLAAQINVYSAGVYVAGTMNLGSGGHIYISGIGLIRLTGDHRSELEAWISNGQITCPAGKTLEVTYDGTYSYAQIPQNPNSMITEYPDSVVLKTDNLVCCFEKNTGNILSYRYKGVETISNKSTASKKYAYHDFTTSYGFETMFGCTYEVITDSADFAHIVFKRPYTPSLGHVTPCDVELHYALRKGDKGVYVYSKLEHKPNYKAFNLGSWRQVWWMATTDDGNNLCEHIYADSLRNWVEYSPNDASEPTGIAEIIKLTSGARAGKFDGKYEYSMKFWDNPVWGHASDINHIGLWMVNASCEYYNEGPTYHDLNTAAGILHQCMNGVHYGAIGLTADTLTGWTKVYGPYLMLITDENTADENWVAAKQRQLAEKALWPYNWVKDTVAYPPASLRGSVSGIFKVSDALQPGINGAGAWIGLTNLDDGASDFQFECKSYQYWIRVNADGSFNIPNVRPGTYTLFAYQDGEVGEFRQENVTVIAGTDNNLGSLDYKIDRSYGSFAWEIGVPDRMADEFKFGDFGYCEGFVQYKFRDSFPNPIEYNVSDKNWSEMLCYAHTKYPAADSTPGDVWKWRLNFNLPANFPTSGNARLTIAYASSDHAQQWIYVNNENSIFKAYYPANGDGNAFVRQSNYAKYSYSHIDIPLSKLHAGGNTVTLVMPSNSAWVSHIMYDYISLELPIGTSTPVHLQDFDVAALANQQSRLTWKTSLESNSDYYGIERSYNGVGFDSIGRMNAFGDLNGADYNFLDTSPTDGMNYYRLKMVDKDGTYSYSKILSVKFALKQSKATILLYPNPVKNKLTIKSASGGQIKSITVINAAGRNVFSDNQINSMFYDLNMTQFGAGFYFIKINLGRETLTKSIVKY